MKRIAVLNVVVALVLTTAPTIAGKPEPENWSSPEGLTKLYESGEIDQLLLGALMAAKRMPSPYSAEDFYRAALTKDPSHKLVLYSLMVHCLYQARPRICAEDHLDTLRTIDVENGAVWAASAELSYEDGDRATALDYLKRAADAPSYDTYFNSYFTFFDRVLPGRERFTSRGHVERIFGMIAAAPHSFFMAKPCQSETDMHWTNVCLDFARAMEEKGKILMTSRIGLGLQARLLERLDRPDLLLAAKTRSAVLETRMDALGDPWRYFPENDIFWERYLETHLEGGEAAAMDFFARQAEGREPLQGVDDPESRKAETVTPAQQVSEGLSLAAAAKAAVAEFVLNSGKAPADRTEAGMTPNPADTTGKYVESIDIVSGVVAITYGNLAHPALQGMILTLAPYVAADGSLIWVCGYRSPPPEPRALSTRAGRVPPGSTLPPDFTPTACRP